MISPENNASKYIRLVPVSELNSQELEESADALHAIVDKVVTEEMLNGRNMHAVVKDFGGSRGRSLETLQAAAQTENMSAFLITRMIGPHGRLIGLAKITETQRLLRQSGVVPSIMSRLIGSIELVEIPPFHASAFVDEDQANGIGYSAVIRKAYGDLGNLADSWTTEPLAYQTEIEAIENAGFKPDGDPGRYFQEPGLRIPPKAQLLVNV